MNLPQCCASEVILSAALEVFLTVHHFGRVLAEDQLPVFSASLQKWAITKYFCFFFQERSLH